MCTEVDSGTGDELADVTGDSRNTAQEQHHYHHHHIHHHHYYHHDDQSQQQMDNAYDDASSVLSSSNNFSPSNTVNSVNILSCLFLSAVND